ncbi:MAG: PilN domain-containing protein [Gemmatimonadales bacterium]
MITINLKPGARRQAAKGDAIAGMRERLRGLGQKVKEPGLVLAGGTWLAAILVVGVLFLRTQSRLNTLEPAMQHAQDEYQRYHSFVTQKRHEEKIRDSILAQIGTISAVDQDRYTWSHLLDEIGASVPDFTWLTSISPVAPAANQSTDTDSTVAAPVTVLIAGETNDLQNYTAFLRRLGESHWLTNVVPVKTETLIDRNRPIVAFTVQATFIRADSSQIQTVPILESTVR